jgi:hypothetical protein
VQINIFFVFKEPAKETALKSVQFLFTGCFESVQLLFCPLSDREVVGFDMIMDKASAEAGKVEGVGVMKDKKPKREEIEACHQFLCLTGGTWLTPNRQDVGSAR